MFGLSYLSSGLQAAGKLDLVDAMVHWLAVGGALGHRALAATAAHTDAVDNVTWETDKTVSRCRGASWCLAAFAVTHPAWLCIQACEPCRAGWV